MRLIFIILIVLLFIPSSNALNNQNISAMPINVTTCGNLDTDGASYNQLSNISCSIGWNIVANNISINGNNNIINFSIQGIRAIGYNNINISNFTLIPMNGNSIQGIYIYGSNNDIISNINIVSEFFDFNFLNTGIHVGYSNNNIIRMSSLNIYGTGIFLESSNYNNISNISGGSGNLDEIYLCCTSNYNNMYNNNIYNTIDAGIRVSSDYNNIYNNIIYDNNNGILIMDSNYNTIYNNNLNNSINAQISLWDYPSESEYWNTTQQLGTNIIGGSYIGGNYWGNPNNLGYSNTCLNYGNDGICDYPYEIDSYNIDYLPLTYNQLTPLPYPPTPIYNGNVTGNFWIYHQWKAGIGNVTDSYNVSRNGTWTNGTTATSDYSSVGAHGWSNITVYAWNNSGNGSLSETPVSANTQVPNNALVQTPIGNQSAIAGNWLNFSIPVTDIDNDMITYGTNATKGNFIGWQFSWLTNTSDVGTYYWYFNSSDGWGSSGNETLNVTVEATPTPTPTPTPTYPPNITAWANNINGWNQTTMNINVANTALFNITINQTVSNVSWKINDSEEQNTSSLSFTRLFNTIGSFNVTAQAFNENGSSNVIYTIVTVSEGGGGGTDWDYANGYITYPNTTVIDNASITTSQGTAYSNGAGYFSFGYVFVHGQSYGFNITKYGHTWNNSSVIFDIGDYQVVNRTIDLVPTPTPTPSPTPTPTPTPPPNSAPYITSWGNNNTSDGSLTLTVDKSVTVRFNITSNQTLTGCTWTGITTVINCSGYDSYAEKTFGNAGIQYVSSYGTNENGSTQTITWTINVNVSTGLTIHGYVMNTLEVPLENARIDINGTHGYTNVTGYYSLSGFNEGNYEVLTRAIGYRNNSNVASLVNATTEYNVTMKERTVAVQAPGFEGLLAIIALVIIIYYRRIK